MDPGANAHVLQPGKHPGFNYLKAKPGVYRCKLRPDLAKSNPDHSDYKGVLLLTGCKCHVNVWVHSDGTLGLRLEKMRLESK
jgi:hypothetical protein